MKASLSARPLEPAARRQGRSSIGRQGILVGAARGGDEVVPGFDGLAKLLTFLPQRRQLEAARCQLVA